MYKELAKDVMVVADNRWIKTTAVLTTARGGGYQVNYIDGHGLIVKREPYSKSPYYRKDKAKAQ